MRLYVFPGKSYDRNTWHIWISRLQFREGCTRCESASDGNVEAILRLEDARRCCAIILGAIIREDEQCKVVFRHLSDSEVKTVKHTKAMGLESFR